MNDIECTTCIVFASETDEPQTAPTYERTEPLWLLVNTLVQEALA